MRGPIAIVGIGCRFPGRAASPTAFWRLLIDGVDAIREVPPERFDLNQLFDADPAAPGKIYSRWGGFVDGIDLFDPGFFGFSRREALRIDPQHRMLLETAWEALEDAGVPANTLAGAPVGVFVGISTHDYPDIQTYPSNRTLIDAHTNSGGAGSIASNRISYVYDFRGPSFSVDTACSSSLVATHLACQSLWNHECELALVGGVQAVIAPEVSIGFCKASMLSPDGRCKAFSAEANGYVRGEGAGVVVLKPLSRALADGDSIYAVVRGSAINEDGRTNGMTMPSLSAQQAVLRDAYARAGVRPGDVCYVEAHGTGTVVGDPIEAEALGTVLARDRPPGEVLRIGSVKTNIGHLEAASGIAGLIKAVLALKHRQIPPSLHFHTPNPAIPFDDLRLRVVSAGERWPNGAAVAGVNSFGFGGANAHVVLEAPPSPARAAIPTARVGAPPAAAIRSELIVVSARSQESLRELARRYRDLAAGDNPPHILDLASAAALHRAHHEHRLGVVGADLETIADNLDAYLNGETRVDVVEGRAPHLRTPRIAFVFTGMGPQWWGMGRQLLEREPVFRAVVEECDRLNRRHASWSVIEELMADEARTRASVAEFATPLNFALQAGLLALWESWGVSPAAVVGHSAGEIAAAYASDALDLEDAMRVAFFRGLLQQRASGHGAMAAVGQGLPALRPLLDSYEGRVAVAAINSPTAVTLSGDRDAIAELAEALGKQGTFCRVMAVEVAYHSHHMDAIRADMLDAFAALRQHPVTVPIVSEVTGDWANDGGFDAEYWWRNTREPVRFADAVLRLAADGMDTFVEIGPHPVLSASINECLAHAGVAGACFPSLRRNEEDRRILLRTLAALHARGANVAWDAVYSRPERPVSLPLYAWNKERVWLESLPMGAAVEAAATDSTRVLGIRMPTVQPHWEADLDGAALGFVHDHRIHEAVVFPGAGYVAMSLDAAAEMGQSVPVLEDTEFKKALFVPDGAHLRMQTVFDTSSRVLTVHAQQGTGDRPDGWTVHASCRLSQTPVEAPPAVDVEAIRQRCGRALSHEEFYRELRQRGFTFGPRFMGLEALQQGDGEALGFVRLPEAHRVNVNGGRVHPALFDAGLQVLIAAVMSRERPGASAPGFLPTRAARVISYHPVGSAFWSHATLRHMAPDGFEGTVSLFDESGTLLMQVEGLRAKTLEHVQTSSGGGAADLLYRLVWEEQPAPAAPASIGDGREAWCSPQQVAAAVNRDADRLSEALGFAGYYRDVEPVLERIARAFFVRGLSDLKVSLQPGATFALDVLPDGTKLTGPRRRQFAAMIAALADTGDLSSTHDVVTIVRTPSSEDPVALIEELRALRPSYGCLLDLVARCGLALSEILSGSREAPDVLFSGDGGALMRTFYHDAPSCRLFNALTAEAVASAVGSYPEHRELRVLEIGAGTGATTRDVLARLPEGRFQFTFTDISSHFLNLARAELGTPPFMRYATLDIERDVQAQGFEAGAFDLVIAANVVHATRDVAKALSRVRSLVAPGGLLVLEEITRGPRWLDLVFGITDGWWAFEDTTLRTERAVLDVATWEGALAAAGFEDPARITEHGDDVPGQSVIVARAPLANGDDAARGGWLVLADRQGLGVAAAEALGRQGCKCAVAFVGDTFRVRGPNTYDVDPADAGSMPRFLRCAVAELGAITGVVHLWSLDMPASAPHTTGAALLSAQSFGYGSMLDLLHAFDAAADVAPPTRVVLVTAGAQAIDEQREVTAVAQSPLWGFGRVLLLERPGLRPVLVDCSAVPDPAEAAGVAREALAAEREDEVALRGTRRYARRIRRLDPEAQPAERLVQPANGRPFQAQVATTGSLDGIVLRAASRRTLGPDDIEIEVKAASLNFRDVMFTMGMLPAAAFDSMLSAGALGVDCAGIVRAVGDGVTDVAPGDEVIALSPASLASHTVTKDLVARKPASLSFAEAAALPLAYVTAVYALENIARIQPGERVLIHAATGGVGLAALAVAERAGAEIFATAGSESKRHYLRERGIRHVMDSRTLDFAREVMEATGGRGVDIVLNSLSGDAIRAGLSVLAPRGRFLEIGKADIYRKSELPLDAFRNNISFAAIQIDVLSDSNRGVLRDVLRAVSRGIDDGTLPPLPAQTFSVASMSEGLRTLAQAKHVGKVVIAFDNPDVPIEAAPEEVPLFRRDATYLVVGGGSGVGLALAEWAVGRGARRLALMNRTATRVDGDPALVRCRELGAEVLLFDGDVTRLSDVERAVRAVDRADAPLKGIFHGAMVMDDGLLAELDADRFARVMAPKAAGAWNLHIASRALPLDHFVLFSSITSVFGNRRQGNYASANAFLDALAGYRRAQGLPALTVNWGVFGDVGYVSARKDLQGFLERQGQHGLSIDEAFTALAALIADGTVQATVARIDWPAWSEWNPVVAVSPKFQPVLQSGSKQEAEAARPADRAIDDLLSHPPAERRPHIVQHLRRRVAKVLGAAPDKVESGTPLTEMGMDSLMAVELTTVLKNDLGIEMPVVKLLQGVTIDQLADVLAERLQAAAEPAATPHPPPTSHAPGTQPYTATPTAPTGPLPSAPSSSRQVAVAERQVEESRVATLRPAAEPSRAAADHPGQPAPDFREWTPLQRVARAIVTSFTRAVADVRIDGVAHVPKSGPVLLAANHISMWDAPVLLCAAERRAVMFAAEELRHRPLMHWTLHKIWDAIYLRRGAGDVEALARGVEVLRGGGMLGLAPEGHRSRSGLQQPLTGIAHLAYRTGAPILPIAVYGQERIVDSCRRLKRARVHVRVGAPIHVPPGAPTAEALRDQTDRVMLAIARLLPREYRGYYTAAIDAEEAEARVEIA